ncbi:MAG: Prolipoprotein diacylglyceryl transferase [Pseudomonadota bacterium]|jgi:phosphatidylglycerol:prolipoprotein diacylglycerol transferase
MHPTLYELNGLALHSWGLMVTLAFLGAFLVVHLRAPRVGIDPDRLVPMYMLLVAAGLAGSRVLHFVFAQPADLWADPLILFNPSRGGFAFYGGVIGGVGAGALFARLRGIPVWKLADLGAPTIMLGLAIGRVGCFFAGCCHGAACPAAVESTLLRFDGGEVLAVAGFPWVALEFNGLGVGRIVDRPVYPTQLFEITTGLGLFAALSAVWARHRRWDGQVLALMLVGYALARTFNETFRGDTVRGLYALGPVTVSTSQIVAAFMIGLAGVIFVTRRGAGIGPELPLRPRPEDDAPMPPGT